MQFFLNFRGHKNTKFSWGTQLGAPKSWLGEWCAIYHFPGRGLGSGHTVGGGARDGTREPQPAASRHTKSHMWPTAATRLDEECCETEKLLEVCHGPRHIQPPDTCWQSGCDGGVFPCLAIFQPVHTDRQLSLSTSSPEMAAYERTLINEVEGTLTSQV